MKKLFYSFVLLMFAFNTIAQQDTIIGFTFPSNSADSLPDVAISLNVNRYLSCEYGTWGATTWLNIPIDYTADGSLGTPDKCAQVMGLDNGADSVFFMIKFKTTGYHNLKLYSKQNSDSNYPGPRDFKVQYKLSGSTSPWIDIPNGVIVCANDWTTGVLDGIDLPTDCNDQGSNVSLRWLQTSNLDINGNALLASGITKIDDIIITGELMTNTSNLFSNNRSLKVYPNPSNGTFIIDNLTDVNSLQVINILGKTVYFNNDISEGQININNLDKGIYFVQSLQNDNTITIVKVIVK